MNIYFVIQITKTKDSQAYATAITIKNSYNEAKMLYHQILSSVYASADNMYHSIVKIEDVYGNTQLVDVILPHIEPSDDELVSVEE